MVWAQFGSDLDRATQQQLTRGARLEEVLKQGLHVPQPQSHQICILYAATNGYLDDLEIAHLADFERELNEYIDKEHHDVHHELERNPILTKELEAKLRAAVEEFKEKFLMRF